MTSVVDLDKQRPVRLEPDATLGRTGLKQSGGYLYEEYLRDIAGPAGRRVYREMSRNDPIIGGFLFAISSILAAVDWHTEPEDPARPEDVEAAEFVEQCREDMAQTWSEFVVEALSLLVYGWAYFEVTWKRRAGSNRDRLMASRHDDGRWGWAEFGVRGQDSLLRWQYDEDARLRGMIQLPPPDFKTRFIPVEKAVHFRLNPEKDSPEGVSLLRPVYRPWFFKRRLQELEAIGIERDMAGLPVLYVPSEVYNDPSRLEAWKRLVRDLKRDEQEGAILPGVRDENGNRHYELTLLSTGSRRQPISDDIIKRYNAEMAMAALSDFMLLGHTRTGTFALGVTKTDFFATAFSYVLDVIANEINERELPRLMALNQMDGHARLTHGKPGNVDVEKFSKMLVNLGAAGLPLLSEDGERERFIFDLLGLPAGDVEGRTPLIGSGE